MRKRLDDAQLQHMRSQLIAYYSFDLDEGGPQGPTSRVARDRSGRGNHLPLSHMPTLEHDVTLQQVPETLAASTPVEECYSSTSGYWGGEKITSGGQHFQTHRQQSRLA